MNRIIDSRSMTQVCLIMYISELIKPENKCRVTNQNGPRCLFFMNVCCFGPSEHAAMSLGEILDEPVSRWLQMIVSSFNTGQIPL